MFCALSTVRLDDSAQEGGFCNVGSHKELLKRNSLLQQVVSLALVLSMCSLILYCTFEASRGCEGAFAKSIDAIACRAT